MKKSLSLETMFLDLPFADRFRSAGEVGHGFVEFGQWTELDLTQVKEALSLNSLRLASLRGGLAPALEDVTKHGFFLEHLSQSIAVGIFLSCTNVMLEGGFAPAVDAAAGGSPLGNAARLLSAACDKAARSGVTLFFKPLPASAPTPAAHAAAFAQASEMAAGLVRTLASPALRLCLDLGYFTTVTADDAEALVKIAERYRDILGYVQVGDANLPCLPALGRLLRERLGYDGFVGFRLHSEGRKEACVNAVRDF